jgi:hypothetical protein
MVARTPRRWLPSACWPAAAAVLGATTAGRADEGRPTMRIVCPDLADDDGAALEARARAELSVEPLREGTLVVNCGDRRVSIEGSGVSLERDVAPDVNGVAFVDELLTAVHALLVEARRADAKSATVVADQPEQASPSSPPGPLERKSGDSERSPPRDGLYRFASVGGFESEVWSGAIGAAIGGHVGARLSSRAGWATELDGGVVWGLGSAQAIEARTLRSTLRVDYAPVERLRIALGLDVRLLMARASGATSPVERDGATFGALAAACYALRVDRFELLAGPQAEVLAWPVVVQVNGSEVLRLPTLLAGLSVEVAADLIR